MAGKAGTPRFGINPEEHLGKTSADGVSKVASPVDGPITEVHFAYNPAMKSRPMSGDPGDCYQVEPRQADYMCNHDGYMAGDMHLMNMDERKVLDNTIMSTPVDYAENHQKISGTYD